METLLAFVVTAILAFSAGAFVQYKFKLKKQIYNLREDLRPSVVHLIELADGLKDTAEDLVKEKVERVSELARRIKSSY